MAEVAPGVGGGAARGVAWTALEQWGGQVVSLVIFLLLARLLSPTAFGLIAMAGVVIALLQAAVEQSFSDALVQRPEVGPELLDTAFWSTLAFGCAAGLAVLLAAAPVAALFSEPPLRPVVMALSASLPLAAAGATHHAILRRRLDFQPIAARALYSTAVGGVAAIGVAVAGGGVWSLVAQALVTSATGTILLWRAVRWRPSLRFARREAADLGRFGGSLIGANLANFANRYADDLVVGLVLGPVALGYYTVAYRLFSSGTRLMGGVASAVAFPAFSRLQRDRERLRAAFYRSVRIAATIGFPAFAGVVVLAPELIGAVLGDGWEPASPVLRVLALMGLLHSVFYLNTSALMAAGRPGWVLRLNVLNAVLNVIAFSIAVRWGIVAVAAAYVIRGYATAPLYLLVLRRVIGLDARRYGRELGAAAAGALVMAVAVAGLVRVAPLPPAALVLIAAPAGVVVYAAVLLLLDRQGVRALWAEVKGALRAPAAPMEAPDRATEVTVEG